MNNIMLVGRLVETPQINYDESDKKYTRITLAVNRTFKNAKGIYETDFIPCMLYGSVAENTCEYCRKGDIMGVKGRLETRFNEETDNKYLIVIAERVSFLSASKQESEE